MRRPAVHLFWGKHPLLWAVLVLTLVAIFLLDVFTPRGFESDDFFVPLILVIALFGGARQVAIAATAMTVLDVVGFLLATGGIAIGWAAGNLAFGVLTIWLTALLVFATRRLWEANTNLQAEIVRRKQVEEELKKALAVKDDFLGMVSHEMRTPLTAITGIASLLEGRDVEISEEERAELVTELNTASQRLSGTIQNMLALARLQAGKSVELTAVSLRAIVDEQVSEHLKRHADRKIAIHQEELLPKATASVDFVGHVLANLIENAEKYSSPQETIEIELRREGDEETVRVLDRGAGLTDDETTHVFESFYRSPRLARGSPGMGIGLSVCKRLVEEQGGRIWALPRPDGGSEFGFSLPLAPAVSESYEPAARRLTVQPSTE
jgi:signal transduction histidine kinase